MPDHNTIVNHHYERHGAGDLTSYMTKEDTELYDRHGKKMDSRDVQEFIDYSEKHQMTRHMVMSPENADELDHDQLHEMAKKSLRDTVGRREDVEYAYAIHENEDGYDHVHAVMTGPANHEHDPGYLDEGDLANIREATHYHAKEVEKTHSVSRFLDKTREEEQEAEAERTVERTADREAESIREMTGGGGEDEDEDEDEAGIGVNPLGSSSGKSQDNEKSKSDGQTRLERWDDSPKPGTAEEFVQKVRQMEAEREALEARHADDREMTGPPWNRVPPEEAEEEEEDEEEHGYGYGY